MSLEAVRELLAKRAPDIAIVELSFDTNILAMSEAWHVPLAQIAKTLAVRAADRVVLVVVCGDSKLDNRKAKAAFGGKTSMVGAEEEASLTGHPAGGLCPFGLETPLPVFCDVGLESFDFVVLGAGSRRTALEVAPRRLGELVSAVWVDVARRE